MIKNYILILLLALSLISCKEENKENTDLIYIDKTRLEEVKQAFLLDGSYNSPEVELLRNLKSETGDFLKIATGVYEIYGDYKLKNQFSIPFNGHQKKKKITFKGFTQFKNREHLIRSFKGDLNLENGSISGVIINNREETKVVFKPFKEVDIQRFKIKTHSVTIFGETFINGLKITNINSGRVHNLDGFLISTYYNSVVLEDINFDGYFDLRIRSNNTEIFWGYNFIQEKFEPIEVLNMMECELGFVNLNEEFIVVTSHKYESPRQLKFVPDVTEDGTVYFGIDEF